MENIRDQRGSFAPSMDTCQYLANKVNIWISKMIFGGLAKEP